MEFTKGQIESNNQIGALTAALTSMIVPSAAPSALAELETRMEAKIVEAASETNSLLRELIAKKK
jgi:hypothetical protein